MNCKNCNKVLSDTQKYCDECGAKVIRNRLTPKVLAIQVNQEFLSLDNKFLRTLICLFTTPEDVIGGFIDGTRKKYINAITYYAISLTLLGFQMFLLKQFFPEFLEPQFEAFKETFKVSGTGNENPFANYGDFFSNSQGIFFSVLMPFTAIGTWLTYLDKRKYNYTEHLVINLYITAQTIFVNFVVVIIMAVFNVFDYLIASIIITPPIILYGAYVFKRLYNLSYINSLVRYIGAYIMYTIVFSIIIAIISVIAIIYLFATGKINL